MAKKPRRFSAWRWAVPVLLVLILDAAFCTGFYGSDDVGYLNAALRLGGHGEPYDAHFAMQSARLPVVLHVAGITLAGAGVQAAAGSFVVYHVILVLLTYALARRMHCRRIARLAGVLVAVCPLAVTFAGCILPDLPCAVYLTAAFVVLAPVRENRQPAAPANFWAGVLLGVAAATKVSSILILPGAVAMLFPRSRDGRRRILATRACVLGLGFGAAVLVFLLAFRAVTGEGAEGIGASLVYGKGFAAAARKQGILPWHRLSYLWSQLGRYLGLFRPFLAVAMIGYPFCKRRSWLLWGSTLWLIAFSVWGSVSLRQYVPPPIQARYLTIVLPFLAIFASALVCSVWAWAGRRRPWLRIGARGLLIGLGVLLAAGSISVCGLWAGRLYRAPEASALPQALTYADCEGDGEILLSRYLSYRYGALAAPGGTAVPPRMPIAGTTPERAERLAAAESFILLITEYEWSMARRGGTEYVKWLAPRAPGGVQLDLEIFGALAGENERFQVTLLKTFYGTQPPVARAVNALVDRLSGSHRARPSTSRAVHVLDVRPRPAARASLNRKARRTRRF